MSQAIHILITSNIAIQLETKFCDSNLWVVDLVYSWNTEATHLQIHYDVFMTTMLTEDSLLV